MAKNIDFMGAVYSDVPSVRLPQQGGGLVGFDDTTDADATASDIAQGKTAYVNGQKIVGTGTGGTPVINPLSVTQNGTYTAPSGVDGYSPVVVSVSGGSVEENDVTFYDYDGTVVASYSADDFANLSAMPANPSHTGLTAQGWNWTLADAKTHVAKYGILDIGQMYITDDEKTRLYCRFEEGALSPLLGFGLNGTAEIDWGDGSSVDTLTGTNQNTTVTIQHTYASPGEYVISFGLTSTGTTDRMAIRGSSSSISDLLRKNTSTSTSTQAVYAATLKKVELGSKIVIGPNAFAYMRSLESITMPSHISSFGGEYAFNYCYSLKHITAPTGFSSLTSISFSSYTFNYCLGLKRIVFCKGNWAIPSYCFQGCNHLSRLILPDNAKGISYYAFSGCTVLSEVIMPDAFVGVTSISDNAFQNVTFMQKIKLPDNLTTIGSSVFSNCQALSNITIPSSVTTIGSSVFNGCYGLRAVHLLRTTPPSLGSSAFNNVPTDCVIYVPYSADHSILAAYQTATNWSAQASKMVEEPAP